MTTKTQLNNALNARLTETHNAMSRLDDKSASICVSLLPVMKYDGELIAYKTRINWNGNVKMAAQDLYDTELNNPDNAPNLWTDISYRDGFRFIPEIITAADAFAKGEKGWWNDELYESTIDNNVWNPSAYPDGWQKVE